MTQMHDDDGIPPILRDAYEAAPDIAEPSDALRMRTLRALRRRGLLRSTSRPRTHGWIAAALVGAAFLGGYAVGRGGEPLPISGPGNPPELRSDDPAHMAELAQGTGTAYALALVTLVESLDRASAAEVATAHAVLRSATEAQAEPLRLLLGPSEPSTFDGEPVVWF
jgi:hypothetical protein